MNMFLTGIIIINIVCVGIIDCTDATSIMKKILVYIITRGKFWTDKYTFKLFECSLCCTFWLSNLWLLVCLFVGTFNIWFIAVPIISALFTKHTYQFILLLQDIIETLINIMNKLLKLINKL